MNTLSLGDIVTSRYWLSIERKPWAWWRWGFSYAPTYCGTNAGLYMACPLFVLLAHRRMK